MVGIDLTGVLYTWLKDGTLNPYLFSNTTEWPIPTSTFFEMFCALLHVVLCVAACCSVCCCMLFCALLHVVLHVNSNRFCHLQI